MKKENNWIKPLIVIVVVSGLSVWASSLQTRTQIRELASNNKRLQRQVETLTISDSLNVVKMDSLQDELFYEKTFNGRYELSLDFLRRVNPRGANQFTNYMNTQTE